jgi:hypothetical protein
MGGQGRMHDGARVSKQHNDGIGEVEGLTREARTSRRAGRFSALALALLTSVGGAMADDAFAQDPDDDAAPGADLAPSGVLSDASGQNLTPAEQLKRAEEFSAGIERASQSILRQLELARRDRDVVRVLCLNDKLNQVDVALRSAQDRLSALRTAVARGDDDRARHEFTVLDVLNDRVRVLVNESNQCVGEETGFIGEAEVSVTIDPNLPDAETGGPGPDGATPPPPNVNSPID